VSKTADAKEIKKAYRKAAIQHHPDKGGDEHTFKEINAAYEILSDPQKRSRYDKFGLEGVSDDDHGGGPSPDDLFNMFFGGSARGSRGPMRGEDVNHPLKVSLEDLYNGKTVKLAINRQVLVGEPTMCMACDGQGVVVELRQIALGMVQQIQRKCNDCGGEGYCAQRKKERKVLEVYIEKGMRHNQKVVFRGMADEKPNMEAGNINFIIQGECSRKFVALVVVCIVSFSHHALYILITNTKQKRSMTSSREKGRTFSLPRRLV
jgi:DnaJ family protein A protein 2